jgi:hypothetical protein
MASLGSWPSIRKHGLLSALALVDLFEIEEPRRTNLLCKQRTRSEPISHPIHGTAWLRDQKPLSAKNLARCLTDCKAKTWYRILNQRVFFWLDRDRLLTLMSASEYIKRPHTILHINAAELVRHYAKKIELAHMNTGNTRPYPHPRGRATFRKLRKYPYAERERLSDYSAIVELTITHGVEDIRKYVQKVEHAKVSGGRYRIVESLWP